MFILFTLFQIFPLPIFSHQTQPANNIFLAYQSPFPETIPLNDDASLILCNVRQLPSAHTATVTSKNGVKSMFSDQDVKLTGIICGQTYTSYIMGNTKEMKGSLVFDSGEAFVLLPSKDGSYSSILRDEIWDDGEMSMPWAEISTGKWIPPRRKGRRELDIIADIIGGGRGPPNNSTVCVHFDIGVHILEITSEEKAMQYFIDLMAIITSKAYLEVGFILEACSFSFRDEEIGADTSSMLSHVQKEQGLDGTNSDLWHHVTSKRLGGGEGYVSGICYRSWGYAVSTGLSMSFAIWDQQVIAHEIGHNFGLSHTHDLKPPLDQCNVDCSTMPSEGGTIMSYCHQCGSRRMEFHELQKPIMVETYKKSEYECMPRYWLWDNMRIPFLVFAALLLTCAVFYYCRRKSTPEEEPVVGAVPQRPAAPPVQNPQYTSNQI